MFTVFQSGSDWNKSSQFKPQPGKPSLLCLWFRLFSIPWHSFTQRATVPVNSSTYWSLLWTCGRWRGTVWEQQTDRGRLNLRKRQQLLGGLLRSGFPVRQLSETLWSGTGESRKPWRHGCLCTGKSSSNWLAWMERRGKTKGNMSSLLLRDTEKPM